MAGYPHCTDEEISIENLSNVLKVSHLVFHTAERGCKAHIRTPAWAVVPARSQMSVLRGSRTGAELAAGTRGAVVGPFQGQKSKSASLKQRREFRGPTYRCPRMHLTSSPAESGAQSLSRPRLLSSAAGSPQCGKDSCWQLQTDILPA